jgi:murein DD-endopeptidase MepM/ murein hydrolase activator NlpD
LAVSAFIIVNLFNNHTRIEESQRTDNIPSEDIPISAIYTGEIHKNSSLFAELLNQEVPEPAVAAITTYFSRLFDLTHSHPGDEFKLFLSPGDSVLAFEYITNDLKKYRLEKVDDGFIDYVTTVELERQIEFASTTVKTSLWEALIPVLPSPELMVRITDIYAWEIDFFIETRTGDIFKVVFESLYKDGEFIKCGDILATEYTLCGVPHRAFLYTDPDGYTDYYDENGYSLRRALLKSPLNYRRISSGYSHRRLHPIYMIYRPHLGIDYAAAEGTPVVTAGDGIIKIKGWVNGFGNYVEIKHNFGLSTGYGHFSRFAKGIVEGRRVLQGQVIGFVGDTGVATGPHLDYRVKKDNRFVNPLRMTVPASPPVKDEYMDEFKGIVAERMAALGRPVDMKLYVLNE